MALESLLKIIKKVFNFTLKALFVLEIFNFCHIIYKFGHVRKRLDKKVKGTLMQI